MRTRTRMASSATVPITARFVDIGANLLDPMFSGIYREKQLHEPDLDFVLERARNRGCAGVYVTAGTVSESRDVLRLAREHNIRLIERGDEPILKSTVGIHPTHAGEVNEADLEKVQRELLEVALDGKKDGTCVAIGECGLDRLREKFAPFEAQRRVWEMHFSLAQQADLPMFIHSRECEDDTLDFLHRFPLPRGGVVHSYDGTLKTALGILGVSDRMYIGVNGCSLRTEQNLEVVKQLPLDRILVESDAPWCEIKNTSAAKPLLGSTNTPLVPEVNKPERLKGQEGKATVKSRNEPGNTLDVLRIIAALKMLPLDQVAQTIFMNTERLFGSPASSSSS